MNEVNVFNETQEEVLEIEDMKGILNYAFQKEKVGPAECNIILVDNKTIHRINREYRQVDRPTDVISFALEDEPFKPAFGRVLGDVYISLEKAKEQAEEYGHSLRRELCFLTIHGFLHLLGYDHIKIEDENKMFAKQKEILDEYGIYR